MQIIKEHAKQGKFDILLIFMFDRIGRIADETSFIAEWFVQNGGRVWSTQEGKQRFNKCKHELYNLMANETEVAVMRIIFDKYVHEDFVAQRIASHLNDLNCRVRTGKMWHHVTIPGIICNLTYTGVLRNIAGSSLLFGNIFCGHCGSWLSLTTNGRAYPCKDDPNWVVKRVRYICYGKTRKQTECDAQTAYDEGQSVPESLNAQI